MKSESEIREKHSEYSIIVDQYFEQMRKAANIEARNEARDNAKNYISLLNLLSWVLED